MAENPLQQHQEIVTGTKQGRCSKQAGSPTKQAGRSINVLSLIANIFAVATISTNKTRQGRLAWPLSCLPN